VPGDKVATGWREGIELLKLTGLLGETMIALATRYREEPPNGP